MTFTSNPALGASASAFPRVVGAVLAAARSGAGAAGVAGVAGACGVSAGGGGGVEGPHAADRQIEINTARLMGWTAYPMELVPVNSAGARWKRGELILHWSWTPPR